MGEKMEDVIFEHGLWLQTNFIFLALEYKF